MRKLCLLAFLLLPASVFAQQQQDFSKVQIKVTKVSGNVYLLEGSGGNIAASVGDDGILIVDTQFAPLADKIQAALYGIAGEKPIRFVIDTHYHNDHTDGNASFAARGAIIIATENLRNRLEHGSTAGTGGAMKLPQPPAQSKAALPVITYTNDLTIHFNGEDIRVVHFPAAHTDGDSVVYFSKSNVVHMGDEFVRYGFPFIDVNSGGTVQGMISACDRAASQFPADAKVIPGHGALATMDDLRAYSKMMKDTTAAVQDALAQHKTLDQMKSDKILAPWQQFSGNFVNTDAFTDTIYYSLTGSGASAIKQN